MNARRTITTVIATAICLSGCTNALPEGNEEVLDDGSDAQAKGVIAGELLAAVEVAPEHKVEFYDFGDGQTAVRESRKADSGASRLDAMREGMNLADVYRLVTVAKPGVHVPAAILEADKRALEVRAALPRPDLDMPPPESTRVLDTLGGDVGVQDELGSVAALNCSPDHSQDNYSGPWFVQQHCNAGQVRACDHNWGSAGTGWQKGSWFMWQQMEGDWNERGHTHGESGRYVKPCGWPWACAYEWRTQLAWDYDVLPGAIEVWQWVGRSDWFHQAWGTSQCGHLHHAFLYNP